MSAAAVVSELRGRHAKSERLSSRTLVATIDAINEVLAAGQLERSFLAYMGACLSSLEREEVLQDTESATALCAVLAAVMQHVPAGYLRTKFSAIANIVVDALDALTAQGSLGGQKAALACVARVLCGGDGAPSWAAVQPAFSRLLNSTIDSNPKVRKLAREGLTEAAAGYVGTPAQAHASQDIAAGAPGVIARRMDPPGRYTGHSHRTGGGRPGGGGLVGLQGREASKR
jgi:hypothetical protein